MVTWNLIHCWSWWDDEWALSPAIRSEMLCGSSRWRCICLIIFKKSSERRTSWSDWLANRCSSTGGSRSRCINIGCVGLHWWKYSKLNRVQPTAVVKAKLSIQFCFLVRKTHGLTDTPNAHKSYRKAEENIENETTITTSNNNKTTSEIKTWRTRTEHRNTMLCIFGGNVFAAWTLRAPRHDVEHGRCGCVGARWVKWKCGGQQSVSRRYLTASMPGRRISLSQCAAPWLCWSMPVRGVCG